MNGVNNVFKESVACTADDKTLFISAPVGKGAWLLDRPVVEIQLEYYCAFPIRIPQRSQHVSFITLSFPTI